MLCVAVSVLFLLITAESCYWLCNLWVYEVC